MRLFAVKLFGIGLLRATTGYQNFCCQSFETNFCSSGFWVISFLRRTFCNIFIRSSLISQIFLLWFFALWFFAVLFCDFFSQSYVLQLDSLSNIFTARFSSDSFSGVWFFVVGFRGVRLTVIQIFNLKLSAARCFITVLMSTTFLPLERFCIFFLLSLDFLY